jgi:hypothetical protein
MTLSLSCPFSAARRLSLISKMNVFPFFYKSHVFHRVKRRKDIYLLDMPAFMSTLRNMSQLFKLIWI